MAGLLNTVTRLARSRAAGARGPRPGAGGVATPGRRPTAGPAGRGGAAGIEGTVRRLLRRAR